MFRGQFPELEQFLVENDIAFGRRTEGKYDYAPELVQYRPGMKEPLVRLTNPVGEPVVAVRDLATVMKKLKRRQPRQALKTLEGRLGPRIPPLKPLRVVEDDHALPDRVR